MKDQTPLGHLSPPALRYLLRKPRRSQFLKSCPSINAFEICQNQDEKTSRFLLREIRTRLFLYTAEYERMGGDPLTSASLWSQFADQAIMVADNIALTRLNQRYFSNSVNLLHFERCILGLGKLGSNELNPSSDVDLLFFYQKNPSVFTPQNVSEQVFYDKWVRHVRSILHDIDENNFVFRVDLNLRPDGGSASIVNSLESLSRYYLYKGRTWERLIFLRGRAIVDSSNLISNFFQNIITFFYPLSENQIHENADYKSLSFVKDISIIRQQIAEKVPTGRFDIKSSAGTIRDIEFIAQVHQMLDSYQHKILKATKTTELLQTLSSYGLLSEDIMSELYQAYRWYRRIEHALQYITDEQTQRLPDKIEKLDKIVQFLRGDDPLLTIETFAQKNQRINRRILHIADAFFSETTIKNDKLSIHKSFSNKTVEVFNNPKIQFKSGKKELQERAFERISILSPYLERLLKGLDLDAIDFFGKEIIESRSHWFKTLNLQNLLNTQRWLWIRVALNFLDKRSNYFKSTRVLSHFCESALRILLEQSIETVPLKNERPKSAKICILAYGSLGVKELGFLSDIDIIFVCDAKPSEIMQTKKWATAVGQNFIQLNDSFTSFKLDFRLRPNGDNGLLISTYQAFKNYHFSKSELWERQSLLKMRPVVGDLGLCRKIKKVKSKLIYRQEIWNIGSELLAMRSKMLNELNDSLGFHLKSGDGGIIDIEFAVEGLQLHLGRLLKNTNFTSVPNLLKEFVRQDLIRSGEASFLTDTYEKMMTIRHCLILLDPKKDIHLNEGDMRLQRITELKSNVFSDACSGSELNQKLHELAADVREKCNHILMRLS